MPARRLPLLIAGALEELAASLRRRYGAALLDLRLFGSVARGESHEDSDVDVAVVLDRVDWKTQCDVINLAADIGLATGLLLSPTVYDRATWDKHRRQERPLVMDILREGVPL
jgi:predicted nucleotidyltransferase